MAQKRNIVIKTPRGSIYTVKTANGSVTAKMEWNHGFSGQKSASFGKAQEFVDSECIRRMNPETPRLSGARHMRAGSITSTKKSHVGSNV